jgi:hypothetical protein
MDKTWGFQMAQAIADRGKKEKGTGMTQDIIEMAIEAEFVSHGKPSDEESELFVCVDKDIVRFAKLVAAKEREACAEIAEKQRYAMFISLTSHPAQNGTAVGIANAIRARGEA